MCIRDSNYGGSINAVYASGSITGGSNVGALIGGSTTSSSKNGSLTNSYWDSYSTGQANAAGSAGPIVQFNVSAVTSDPSQSGAANYAYKASAYANLDISSQGGSNSIWRIYDGISRPLLRSFLTPVMVTPTQDVSRIYDATTTVNGGSYTGNPSSSVNGGGLLGSIQYTTSSKNVGSYTGVNLSAQGLYSAQSGYDISYANTTGTVTITAKAITASGVTAQNKTYDGNTSATTSGGTLNGVIGGDTVNLTTSGTFTDKNAATGKTVNIINTLSGTDANNYSISNSTTTANITAKGITVTITANNKVYNGSTGATTSSVLSGVIAGDTVTLTTGGAFTNKNAGIGKTVNVLAGALSGADAGNYTVTSSNSTTTADITAKEITATITASNKVYDGNTTATTNASLSGLVGGDTVSLASSGSFTDKNAATGKTVNIVAGALSGADAGNYTLTSSNSSTTANITAKGITGTITAANKVYDGNTTATTSGVLNGLIAGDTVNLASSGTFNNKNAATGKTVNVVAGALSGADAGNYTLTSSNNSTTADITAKSITGTITAANKVYDGNTTATTSASLSGLVIGDTVNLASSGSFTDKNAAIGKTVNIVAGALSLSLIHI